MRKIGRQELLSVYHISIIALVFITESVTAKETISKEPITPIPIHSSVDKQKATLGKLLFHDNRLSGDNTISCASCHPLNNAGVDGMKFSKGIKGKLGVINTPTVFNSGFSFVQFWDGRALSLEEQIEGPIHNQKEMGADWLSIRVKLIQDKNYIDLFKKIYGDTGISALTIKDAIAAFERTLNTPNSRFDQYLRGQKDAITEREFEGYNLFKSYGCSSCHQGVLVGGNLFEKMGMFDDYFLKRGNITESDYGRFNVTGLEEHRYEFKVPSLRNVALTSPYFHDGSAATLQDAIGIMSKYQLGRQMTKEEIDKITGFLHTLTGEFGEYASE